MADSAVRSKEGQASGKDMEGVEGVEGVVDGKGGKEGQGTVAQGEQGERNVEVQEKKERHPVLRQTYVRSGWKVLRPRRLSLPMLNAVCSKLKIDITGEVSEGSLFISHPAFYMEVHVDPKEHAVTKVEIGHGEDWGPFEDPLLLYLLANDGYQAFGLHLQPIIEFYNSVRIHFQGDEKLQQGYKEVYGAHDHLCQHVSSKAREVACACRDVAAEKQNTDKHAATLQRVVSRLRERMDSGLGLTTTRMTDYKTFGPALLWALEPDTGTRLSSHSVALSATGLEKRLPDAARVCLLGTRCVVPQDPWALVCAPLSIQDDGQTSFPAQHFMRFTRPVRVPVGVVDAAAQVLSVDAERLRQRFRAQPFRHHMAATHHDHVLGDVVVRMCADDRLRTLEVCTLYFMPFTTTQQLHSLVQLLRQGTAFLALLESAFVASHLGTGFPRGAKQIRVGASFPTTITLTEEPAAAPSASLTDAPSTSSQQSIPTSLSVGKDGTVAVAGGAEGDTTSDSNSTSNNAACVAAEETHSLPRVVACLLPRTQTTTTAARKGAKRTADEADA